MDRNGDHHVKQNKPDSERQVSYVFSHMPNLDQNLQRHESRRGTIWQDKRDQEMRKEEEESNGRGLAKNTLYNMYENVEMKPIILYN
jgi:hypothetical protein